MDVVSKVLSKMFPKYQCISCFHDAHHWEFHIDFPCILTIFPFNLLTLSFQHYTSILALELHCVDTIYAHQVFLIVCTLTTIVNMSYGWVRMVELHWGKMKICLINHSYEYGRVSILTILCMQCRLSLSSNTWQTSLNHVSEEAFSLRWARPSHNKGMKKIDHVVNVVVLD